MRNFIAFAGIVALLLALIVTAVTVLKLPPIITIIAVAVAALLIAVRAIVEGLAHFRGAAGPTSDPVADARVTAKHEARRRRKQLMARFATVVATLKAAQAPPRLRYRERGGAPWWLVVGPAGHGKSELLRAAPDATELAPPLETDEPRFFLAAGAVFLELPEVSPPAAAPALAALFSALRRLRPRCPLAGVLVVHRADALLDPATLDLRATRRQIDHAAFALAMQAPVVLLVSQLDRLAGLAELLDGLHPVRQPLGVVLPPREGKSSVQAAALASLGAPDGVIEWMRQRCHALVARAEPGTPRQSRLYGLWQQFGRLTTAAATAAAQLAQDPLPGGDPLRMRAIYFTTAHPETFAPEDQWAALLAQRAGGALVSDRVQAPTLPPAFLAELFTVELTQAGIHATRLRRHLRRRFASAALLAVALAAAASAAAHGSSRAAQANERLLQSTLDSAVAVQHTRDTQLAPLGHLDHLRQAVITWRAPNAPEGAGWGLFRGRELEHLVTDAYLRAVCHGVLRPLVTRTHRSLRQFSTRYAGAGQAGRDAARDASNDLRAYLLLSDADEPGEPAPWGEQQSRWLQDHMVAAWTRANGDGEDPRRAAILEAHVALLGPPGPRADPADPCARTGHARALARDPDLVLAVREILNRTPADRDQVTRMVEQVNRRTDLLSLTTRSLTTAHYLRSDVLVHPAFTRPGWRAFQEVLATELDSGGEQTWVLGHKQVAESRLARCTNLRKLYTDLYIKTWERFIRSVKLAGPADLDEAAPIFQELSEDMPLTAIFKAVIDHTQGLNPIPCAESKQKDLLESIQRSFKGKSTVPAGSNSDAGQVAAAFAKFAAFGAPAPTGKGGAVALDSYHKRLAEVRSAIDKARENIEEYPALDAAVTKSLEDIESMIQRGPYGAWKETLQRLVTPPLTDLHIFLNEKEVAKLHNDWCGTVFASLQRSVIGRYPFTVEARDDAILADLEALFHPQNGEIAKFRDQSISPYITISGTTIEARKLGIGARYHLSGPAIDFFDAAHKLGILLYGGGTAGLDINLTMGCAANVSDVKLTIDGVLLHYNCSTDQAKQLHWPGKDGERGAHLTASGNRGSEDIPEPGDFGLLRLLERGNPTLVRPNQSAFTFGIKLTRHNFGNLRATVQPRDLRGGNLFFGFGGARFLGPLRAPGFTHPPHSLFAEFAHTCPALP